MFIIENTFKDEVKQLELLNVADFTSLAYKFQLRILSQQRKRCSRHRWQYRGITHRRRQNLTRQAAFHPAKAWIRSHSGSLIVEIHDIFIDPEIQTRLFKS